MTRIISFNLSTNAIMQVIYAASALRSLSNDDGSSLPPTLTPDHREALKLLIKDSFAFVVMRLVAHVDFCNLNDDTTALSPEDDIILQLDLHVSEDVTSNIATIMRTHLEHAIAAYSLHVCFMGHDDSTSDKYNEMATAEVAEVTRLLSYSRFNNQRITPHYL